MVTEVPCGAVAAGAVACGAVAADGVAPPCSIGTPETIGEVPVPVLGVTGAAAAGAPGTVIGF